MQNFIHHLFFGLANGTIYASIALALVLIYKCTSHFNFALGSLSTFFTYIAWWLLTAHGMPYWGAFFATMIVSFVGCFFIERFIFRPFDKSNEVAKIIIFIALYLIFNGLSGWLFTFEIQSFPSPFENWRLFQSQLIDQHFQGLFLILAISLMLINSFFKFTKLGLAIRSTVDNEISSKLVGVNVPLMKSLGWGIASLMGAITGMLIAPIYFLEPYMMDKVMLYAFASVILGGTNNTGGVVLSGLIVGIITSLVNAYIPQSGEQLKVPLTFLLILAILVFMPTGLFRNKIKTRV